MGQTIVITGANRGIGLAMVHDLILAMDAELSIADREGGGADLQMRFKVDPCPVVP